MNNFVLNRVFSQKTIKDILLKGTSPVLNEAYEQLMGAGKTSDNEEKFASLYKVLEKEYRNEYYYKNTLLNKLLLGRHSLNTTTALSELSIDDSKADFVLLNGRAVVYEIKTELDTLNRLENQINDYYKVFKNVEVVTDESHLDKVFTYYKGSSVGVSVITKNKTIKNVKKAQENAENLNHFSIYRVLRKYEKRNVIQFYYGYLPETNDFEEFEDYFEWFKKIPLPVVYERLVIELKKRGEKIGKSAEQFLMLPYELRSLLYFAPLPRKSYEKFYRMLKE